MNTDSNEPTAASAPMHTVLAIAAMVHAGALSTAGRLRRQSGDEGQTTAEYALVGLAAAAVAMLVMAWATKTDGIGNLLDGVIGKVIGFVL